MNDIAQSCPICKAAGCTDLWHVEFRAKKFTYVRCSGCGLIYIRPIPTHAEVMDGYKSESPDYIYQQDYFAFLEKCEARSGPPTDLVKLISRQLSVRRPEGRPIRALDIGAGSGTLIREMRRSLNWDVAGVEPAPYGAKAAQKYGVRIHNVPFEEFSAEGVYDVVTMMSIVEHTPKPLELLKKARTMVVDGGLLVIETPNAASWAAKLMGSKWWALLPPGHMLMYTPERIQRLLDDAGFRTEKIFVTGDLPFLVHFPKLSSLIRKLQTRMNLSLSGMDSILLFARPK